MSYEFGVPLEALLTPQANMTAPLGTKIRVGGQSLGLTLTTDTTTPSDWMIELTYVRCYAALAGAGYPVFLANDSTYKSHCVTGTFSGAPPYGCCGIATAAATIGYYCWIQTGGLNGWTVTAAAAAIAIGDILYPTADNEVSVADSDAKRLKKLAVALAVDANGAAQAAGLMMIDPCCKL